VFLKKRQLLIASQRVAMLTAYRILEKRDERERMNELFQLAGGGEGR